MIVLRVMAQLLLGLFLLVDSPAFGAESERSDALKVANELLFAIESGRQEILLNYAQSVVYVVDNDYKKAEIRRALDDKDSLLGKMILYGEKSMRNYILTAKKINVLVRTDKQKYWVVSIVDPESRVLVPPMMYIAKIKGKWTLIGIEPFNPDVLN